MDYFSVRQKMQEHKDNVGQFDGNLDCYTNIAPEYSHNADNVILPVVTSVAAIGCYFHFNCNIWYAVGVFVMPFVYGGLWMVQNLVMGLSITHGME